MTTEVWWIVAVVLISVGLFLVVFSQIASQNSFFNQTLGAYIRGLEFDLRFVRASLSGRHLVLLLALATVLDLLLALVLSPLLLILLPIVFVSPTIQLKNLRDRRIVRVEQQLDGWLLILANALKAVPSIGEALVSSRSLSHAPISEEIDIAIKENQLGTPLDEALENMSKRIKSRVVTTALMTLQIARRTGGDLPSTLETAAASLREMARLEGVIRTKTADGRNQAFVLGSLPAILIVALYFAHPDLLIQLTDTTIGNVLLGISIVLWVGAIIVAKRILKVDI